MSIAVTFLFSALSSINAAAIIVGIPEALPRAVRSAGLSIVYALSVSIFGGSTNYLVNKLIAVTRRQARAGLLPCGFQPRRHARGLAGCRKRGARSLDAEPQGGTVRP